MDLETTILSEISWTENDKNHMILLRYGILNKKQQVDKKQTNSWTQTTVFCVFVLLTVFWIAEGERVEGG